MLPGTLQKGSSNQPLILHYDGSSWKQQKSPAPVGGDLFGARAVTAKAA